MIEKIIHQIWFQGKNNIPMSYPNYSDSWIKNNPDYEYVFWDQQKINKLINMYYPQYKEKYNAYTQIINKIDMAKLIILYHYGGIFVDLDSESFKPINKLLHGKDIAILKFNLSELDKALTFNKIIINIFQNS